jgi:hypothetical protein
MYLLKLYLCIYRNTLSFNKCIYGGFFWLGIYIFFWKHWLGIYYNFIENITKNIIDHHFLFLSCNLNFLFFNFTMKLSKFNNEEEYTFAKICGINLK